VARVLAVANQKGGVAKTTSVSSLGAALSELGRRVLLVDLDPQACLTFSLGLDPDAIELSVHDVLLGRLSAGLVVRETSDGPDILPATIELAGCEAVLLSRTGREHARQIRADSPFLLDYELAALRNLPDPAFLSETIYCHFNLQAGPADLEAAVRSVCELASKAVDAGKTILLLSDRFVDASKVPIPMLLAVGAVVIVQL
jgi:cellulose biosynthesis protein BcsQ